jgi:hypothetical protein
MSVRKSQDVKREKLAKGQVIHHSDRQPVRPHLTPIALFRQRSGRMFLIGPSCLMVASIEPIFRPG